MSLKTSLGQIYVAANLRSHICKLRLVPELQKNVPISKAHIYFKNNNNNQMIKSMETHFGESSMKLRLQDAAQIKHGGD